MCRLSRRERPEVMKIYYVADCILKVKTYMRTYDKRTVTDNKAGLGILKRKRETKIFGTQEAIKTLVTH